mmetsp:Transcript_68822/g.193011  ORF Transcript_68822/g.193011 Transcript_68822/m.193011 type:complete len:249 (+) Transcript_68822:194-940(+)
MSLNFLPKNATAANTGIPAKTPYHTGNSVAFSFMTSPRSVFETSLTSFQSSGSKATTISPTSGCAAFAAMALGSAGILPPRWPLNPSSVRSFRHTVIIRINSLSLTSSKVVSSIESRRSAPIVDGRWKPARRMAIATQLLTISVSGFASSRPSAPRDFSKFFRRSWRSSPKLPSLVARSSRSWPSFSLSSLAESTNFIASSSVTSFPPSGFSPSGVTAASLAASVAASAAGSAVSSASALCSSASARR